MRVRGQKSRTGRRPGHRDKFIGMVVGKMRNCGMWNAESKMWNRKCGMTLIGQSIKPCDRPHSADYCSDMATDGGKMQTSNVENARMQCVTKHCGGALLCNADCRCKYKPLSFNVFTNTLLMYLRPTVVCDRPTMRCHNNIQ